MNESKLPRREREKQIYRKEILSSALKLFSEKGYHNVSMHEIARRAEFSVGTLYHFFKNKEDLYKALIMENALEYHRRLNGVLSKESDILTIIEEYISTKARIFAESIDTLRLYFGETHGVSFNIKAGLDEDIRKLYDETVRHLSSVIEKGIQENVIRDVNPYYLAIALEGLTTAFLFCWLEDPDRHPYEANISLIKELFLKGCLAK
jgi:AcrR family transcriptional regulator